jgi:hypothetical protein
MRAQAPESRLPPLMQMRMQRRMQRTHSLLLLLLLLQQQCRYLLLCPLQFLYPNEERRARGSKASARPHVRPLTGICKRPASNLLLPQSCSSFRHTAPRPSSFPASSLSLPLPPPVFSLFQLHLQSKCLRSLSRSRVCVLLPP